MSPPARVLLVLGAGTGLSPAELCTAFSLWPSHCSRTLSQNTNHSESEPSRQQLLSGCLQLLGAPLPAALPSNSAAAAAAAGGCDELWWAAAAAGCHPGRTASDNTGPHAASWVGEVLGQGSWGWLLGGAGSPQPPGLRQRPWCHDCNGHPSRRAMLRHTLTALVQGPCRTDGALAAALLATVYDAGPAGQAPANELAPSSTFDASARQLAKQLLAEQRSNLALWQVRGWVWLGWLLRCVVLL